MKRLKLPIHASPTTYTLPTDPRRRPPFYVIAAVAVLAAAVVIMIGYAAGCFVGYP